VRFITSVYNIGAARWQQVQEALEEAESLFERLGDRRLLGDTWSVQGLLALYRGRFELAATAFAKLYERGARNENVQHQVWACIGWAECELRAGRTGEAARLLETALGLLAEHPDRAEQVRAYGLLAVVRLRRGEETAARAAASTAARLIAQFKRPTSFYLLEGYAGVAEVYLQLWEAGDRSTATRRAARQACSALRTFARVFPIGEPRAQLWTGRLHHLSGRSRQAQRAWRASFSAAQRLGMPFEAALAHIELGRPADGQPQRQWHLQQAQTLLQELGVVQVSPLDPPAR
jgi:tetratricopeptide (TPR) repeat protein